MELQTEYILCVFYFPLMAPIVITFSPSLLCHMPVYNLLPDVF